MRDESWGYWYNKRIITGSKVWLLPQGFALKVCLWAPKVEKNKQWCGQLVAHLRQLRNTFSHFANHI